MNQLRNLLNKAPVYAEIVGWGASVPKLRLTNEDLTTILDTSDEWIRRRTGISQRPLSNVLVSRLALVASHRALAAAGISPNEVDLIVLGSCSPDEIMPNTSSWIQRELGATRAATMDVNTACTSFLHALSIATSFIATSRSQIALVIGADTLSRYMDWRDRRPSILFGDAAGALVLRRSDEELGVLGDSLGCISTSRDRLRIRGIGPGADADNEIKWDFDGPEIFRLAVHWMVHAARCAMEKVDVTTNDIDLVIPHQANLRIIRAVTERLEVPEEKLFVNIAMRGNLSSASIPVAIDDALGQKRIEPNALLLLPAFGGGMTWSAHIVRWGLRTDPISHSRAELPVPHTSALELLDLLMKRRLATDFVP